MKKKPNILLIMTDEQRWDTIGGFDNSVVDTPYLTQLRTQGTNFNCAYSACPVCIPARRTLFSGKKAANHGVLMNYTTPLSGETMADVMQKNGYQTHLSGKLHLFPERKRYGFESADWADSCHSSSPDNDYDRFLREHGYYEDKGLGHGLSFNGYAARPFHLDEQLHYSTWCSDTALRFLERRDPTAPFFLNLSFFQPHAPCSPPEYYFNKYLRADIPTSPMGDWVDGFPNTQNGLPVNAWRVDPESRPLREYKAGYYGCIEQIDHQIGRILYHIPKDDTIVIFLSDHGEMLGDHGWIRKRSAYEGSAHIPFIVYVPDKLAKEYGIHQNNEIHTAVELMDVMPTILDLAGIKLPEGMDGVSLLPLMRGESIDREYIHGECARLETIGTGMQFMTDGKEKYIWYPALAKEQLFDLEADPQEKHDLAKRADSEPRLKQWRERLVKELTGRHEGFVEDGRLVKLDGPTPYCTSKELLAAGENLADADHGESSKLQTKG